jgi:hypothetical protein
LEIEGNSRGGALFRVIAFIPGSDAGRQSPKTNDLMIQTAALRFGARFNSTEAALKTIRAFRETWAPVLFFAAFIGFVGLGISHVDAKVKAEEAKTLAYDRSGCSAKFQADQDAFEQCSQVGAIRLDRVEYGSLRSLFTYPH